ncbi:MAG TPA: hypothetical protein VK119_01550 [Bacillota bacterium]|nr:hypothetical protein [Bacillota bacterium]
MEVHIKRNTGTMGGASNIALIVDGTTEKKMKYNKYNEEYVLTTNQGRVTLSS